MGRSHIVVTLALLSNCVPLSAQRLANPTSAAVFVENKGQFDPAVRYRLTERQGVVWLTNSGIVFEGFRDARAGEGIAQTWYRALLADFGLPRMGFSQPLTPERVLFSRTFHDSRPDVALFASEPALDSYDYFAGAKAVAWPPGAKAFSRVDYKDVWPGISAIFTGNQLGIEQGFVIQPGADPDRIALTYQGIDSMTVDEYGSLVVATAMGTLSQSPPDVYQEIGGHMINVPARYRLIGVGTYSYQIDPYASTYPLMIAPASLTFFRPAIPSAGTPVITFFNVAPTSTLPGQATIATLSVTGATSASINGVLANCNAGQCGGTFLFHPASTTNYVLQASGAGGSITASQMVQVGRYLPNPPAQPPGLKVSWQGACWITRYPKPICNGACQGMAFQVSVPTPPAQLPLEATLYLGTTTCAPAQQDNMNDLGTLTGSGGWIFWFSHHPNLKNSSAIWTFGNQSSGCVSYAAAPKCE